MPDKDREVQRTQLKAMTAQGYDRKKIVEIPHLKPGQAHPAVSEVQNYLKHYGYLKPDASPAPDKLDVPTEKAVRKFQEFFRLPVTGELDEPTKKKMAESRCGFPDELDPLAFSTAGPWNHRAIKYRFGTLCADVSSAVARAAVQRAMNTWTNAGCGLTFTEVGSGTAHDIFIEWRSANDPDHSMVGGVLAHGDFPPPNSIIVANPPLPLHYDDSEHTWVDGAVAGGYDIETVALHEIGHCLGLYHSNVAGSVMYPTVSSNFTKRALTADDLAGIRALYPPLNQWENMGGGIVGEPAVVSWAANRLDIFVKGTNGAVYHKWWNGSHWGPSVTGWENMGGQIQGLPCVVAWGPNRLDVFVRGMDNALYHKWWNGSSWGPSVTGWESLGGTLAGDPVAVSWGPNRLDVFARTTNGSVIHKWWNGSHWGPSVSGWENMGGVIQGNPSAVCWGPNRIDLFVRGMDNALWHKGWNGSSWGPSLTGWESLGGQLTGDPVPVAWAANRLDVFGRGTSGALMHKWWNGSAWGPAGSNMENLGGVMIGDPSAVAWGPNRLDIFVQGTDHAIWHKWWNGSAWGPSFSGWESLGGSADGSPVADPWGSNRLDVFVRWSDGAMRHKWWNGSAWGP